MSRLCFIMLCGLTCPMWTGLRDPRINTPVFVLPSRYGAICDGERCVAGSAYVRYWTVMQSCAGSSCGYLKLCLILSKEFHLQQWVTRVQAVREQLWWRLRRRCHCLGFLALCVLVGVCIFLCCTDHSFRIDLRRHLSLWWDDGSRIVHEIKWKILHLTAVVLNWLLAVLFLGGAMAFFAKTMFLSWYST